MKNVIALALCLASMLALPGCATSDSVHSLPPAPTYYSYDDIRHFTNEHLCEAHLQELNGAGSIYDMKLVDVIEERKINCDPAFLQCKSEGKKPGTQAMRSCIALAANLIAIEKKRTSDPAFAYCLDSGFAIGTQPMATCLTSQAFLRQQKQLSEEQEAARRQQAEQQERAADLNAAAAILGANRQPPPIQTHCTTWNGTVNCTTY